MRIAVFGLGYVGTVTAACMAANGHDVCGIDVDAQKVETIASGRSPVIEPGLAELVEGTVRSGRLRATTSARVGVADADVSLLCVGTPSSAQGGTDLSYVLRAVDDLGRALTDTTGPQMHCVAMRSTVPPGTVEAIGRSIQLSVAGSGRRIGVAMCPEFLREGTGIADFYNPPYTVIGTEDPDVAGVLRQLFSFIDRPVHVVGVRSAEALKYACNAFHAAKVTFANELGRLFRSLEVDSREVMDIFCEDDRLNISSRYLRPGFAFGGSCLPKDLRSILHLARMRSLDLPLLAGTLTSNRLTVLDVVERVLVMPGRSVALLGLSFKPDSDDLRESPYVELAETLLGKGYDLRIYDPIVNPSSLVGTNREYIGRRLPHLQRILTDRARDAVTGAEIAIVSFASAEVAEALVDTPPAQVIDLDGRLGAEVEALSGYQGVSW